MKPTTIKKLKMIIIRYKEVMEVMEHNAAKAMRDDNRAYGGFVRMAKGKIQEYITEQIIKTTWIDELGKEENRLTINSDKIKIPICKSYIDKITDKRVQNYIINNLPRFYYGLSVDKHVFLDRRFVIGIECKAYTENAMIKRILVDFYLLKTKFPALKCYLFQLESQLGGDYSSAIINPIGSSPTHSIMSYFQNVNLEIITFLEGERKIDRPINKPEFFKELKYEHVENAVNQLIKGFQEVSGK